MTQEVAALEAQQIELAANRDYAGLARLQAHVERVPGQIQARAQLPSALRVSRRRLCLSPCHRLSDCGCSCPTAAAVGQVQVQLPVLSCPACGPGSTRIWGQDHSGG